MTPDVHTLISRLPSATVPAARAARTRTRCHRVLARRTQPRPAEAPRWWVRARRTAALALQHGAGLIRQLARI